MAVEYVLEKREDSPGTNCLQNSVEKVNGKKAAQAECKDENWAVIGKRLNMQCTKVDTSEARGTDAFSTFYSIVLQHFLDTWKSLE